MSRNPVICRSFAAIFFTFSVATLQPTAAVVQSITSDSKPRPGSPATGWSGNFSSSDPYSAGPGVGAWVSEVAEAGGIGMGGHFALDANGRYYFLNIEQNAIWQRSADGSAQAIVADPRLIWPDTMAIGADKYLYVTTSQHDRRAEFHDGKDLRRKPYGLYRVLIGAGPATATWR